MQTYFDQVDTNYVARIARDFDPERLAQAAARHSRVNATEYALASIRARGNWMLVNGQWHKRG